MRWSILPMRKRDWKKGQSQVGLFVRQPDGTVLELTCNDAAPEVVRRSAELMREMLSVPIATRIQSPPAKLVKP